MTRSSDFTNGGTSPTKTGSNYIKKCWAMQIVQLLWLRNHPKGAEKCTCSLLWCSLWCSSPWLWLNDMFVWFLAVCCLIVSPKWLGVLGVLGVLVLDCEGVWVLSHQPASKNQCTVPNGDGFKEMDSCRNSTTLQPRGISKCGVWALHHFAQADNVQKSTNRCSCLENLAACWLMLVDILFKLA